VEHPNDFAVAGEILLAEEQRLHARPGEEVRMDDLVRVAREQEGAGCSQHLQEQIELHRRDVLNLVDHDEVIARRDSRQMIMGDEIGVEQAFAVEVRQVLLEQIVDPRALVGEKDRLLDAQLQVLLAGPEAPLRQRPGDHPAEFLEELVRIFQAAAAAVALEEALEVLERDLAPGRYVDAFEHLVERQKIHLLQVIVVAVSEVEIARVLNQVR